MILITDTAYSAKAALTSGVIINELEQASASLELTHISNSISDYISGEFYKRELPCILEMIEKHSLKPEMIIIDGYVYLDGDKSPGLGAYLYEALDKKVEILGVAKNRYKGIGEQHALLRGQSKNTLWVTASTLELEDAKRMIKGMAGRFRLPDMIKRADSLTKAPPP